MGNPRARVGKKKKQNPPAMQGTKEKQVQSLRGGGMEEEMQPTPGFLPGKSRGQRSLEGYCPWGHTESDTTEWPSKHNRENRRRARSRAAPGSAE